MNKRKPEEIFTLKRIEKIFKHWHPIICEGNGRDPKIDWYNFRMDLRDGAPKKRKFKMVQPIVVHVEAPGIIDRIKAYRLKHDCSLKEAADAVREGKV